MDHSADDAELADYSSDDDGMVVAFGNANPEDFGFSDDADMGMEETGKDGMNEFSSSAGSLHSASIELQDLESNTVTAEVCSKDCSEMLPKSPNEVADYDNEEGTKGTDSSEVEESSENETEEDDLTSKLKSIPVLGRIPKRKQCASEEAPASLEATSSHVSVLERINVSPGQGNSQYPNLSTSGWRRTGSDKPMTQWKSWNRRGGGRGAGNQAVFAQGRDDARRSQKGFRAGENQTRNVSENKLLHAREGKGAGKPLAARPAAPQLWTSPAIPEPTICGTFDEKEFSPETGPLPTSGPLPTLPFEEQMRARARMRTRQMLGGSGAEHSGSDSGTPGGVFQPSSSDNSPFTTLADRFNAGRNVMDNGSNNVTLVFPPVKSQSRTGTPSATLDLHTHQHENDRTKNRQHRSRSSHSDDSSSHRKSHSHRSRQSDSRKTDDQKSRSDQPTPPALISEATRKTSNSPPRPELPVLPLFAAIIDEPPTRVTDRSKRTDQMSERGISSNVMPSRNSPMPHLTVAHVSNGTISSRLKAPDERVSFNSAGAANTDKNSRRMAVPSKSVSFHCPDGAEKPQNKASKSDSSSKKKLKYDDKLSLQLQVIEELKTFLKPYYTRRQLSKDQYKDIMRHAVPRICHGRPSQGDMSASRVHKYAKTYIDKTLSVNDSSGDISRTH